MSDFFVGMSQVSPVFHTVAIVSIAQPWWLGGRAAASFNTSLTSSSVDQIPLEEDFTRYNILSK